MPTCPECGDEHDLLDPVFLRPDDYVALDTATRRAHATADDDLCRISLPGRASRFFVRGTLPVAVDDTPDGLRWGVWAEVCGDAFRRILELWSDEEQTREQPFPGTLANAVHGYPDTRGLAVRVELTGPTTRPELSFAGRSTHPFVVECRAGVDRHRAAAWADAQGRGAG